MDIKDQNSTTDNQNESSPERMIMNLLNSLIGVNIKSILVD
jgi:hypothetical protein